MSVILSAATARRVLLGGGLGLALFVANPRAFGQACPRSGGPCLSIFAAPFFDVGMGKQRNALSMGIQGGIGIDDRVYLGLYFGALLSQDVHASVMHRDTAYSTTLVLNHGGVLLQYGLVTLPFLRLLVGGRVGMAGITWRDAERDRNFGTDALLVAPTASLEFPLAYYTRMELGAGYRMLNATNLPMGLQDLSGTFFFGAIRFGNF